MAFVKHIPCGACGADKPSPVGIPRVSKQVKVIISGWETVKVVKCTQCGFYYTDPMPFWDDKDLQVLYSGEYFGDESSWWHRVRTQVDPRRRLDAIAREMEVSKPKLLDIGCGQGYVLEHALNQGWDVWGLEPSKTWAHKTSTRLGVKIWAQRIENADLPASVCDCVFSDSVIEHLAEPMEMMKLVHRVLKPGGIAYFVTPNADALFNHFRGMIFRLDGSQRSPYIEPLCVPYHVVGFTPHSLSVLAERAGFEVRHLWVRHGREMWRKNKRWTASKFKALGYSPVLYVGEIIDSGTTIDTLLIKH